MKKTLTIISLLLAVLVIFILSIKIKKSSNIKENKNQINKTVEQNKEEEILLLNTEEEVFRGELEVPSKVLEYEQNPNIAAFQEFVLTLKDCNFNPSSIEAEKDRGIRLIIDNKDLKEYTLEISGLDIEELLLPGENIIEFTPLKKGEFNMVCQGIDYQNRTKGVLKIE